MLLLHHISVFLSAINIFRLKMLLFVWEIKTKKQHEPHPTFSVQIFHFIYRQKKEALRFKCKHYITPSLRKHVLSPLIKVNARSKLQVLVWVSTKKALCLPTRRSRAQTAADRPIQPGEGGAFWARRNAMRWGGGEDLVQTKLTDIKTTKRKEHPKYLI